MELTDQNPNLSEEEQKALQRKTRYAMAEPLYALTLVVVSSMLAVFSGMSAEWVEWLRSPSGNTLAITLFIVSIVNAIVGYLNSRSR